MAPAADLTTGDLEAQWIAQMKAMRDAIAELKLPQLAPGQVPYGQDIVVEDENSTLASSGDDLWDLIESDEEEADSLSSDDGLFHPSATTGPSTNGSAHDTDWLEQVCMLTASKAGGLDAIALQDQLRALLVSDLQGTSLSRRITVHEF